jgi:hypothetical protein
MVTGASVAKRPQRPALVQSDMIGSVAFDLVLRIILARVMDVAFVVHVSCVHPHDVTADPTGFGIPAHVIPNLVCLGHDVSLRIASVGWLAGRSKLPSPSNKTSLQVSKVRLFRL